MTLPSLANSDEPVRAVGWGAGAVLAVLSLIANATGWVPAPGFQEAILAAVSFFGPRIAAELARKHVTPVRQLQSQNRSNASSVAVPPPVEIPAEFVTPDPQAPTEPAA